MKKKLVTILCGALVASVALPALADSKINGYFRVQGIQQKDAALGKDLPAESFVAQRLRVKWTNNLTDFVSVVYFAEVDTDWGMTDKLGGNGGQISADGVNIETKNAFATIKLPANTDIGFTVGLQGIADHMQSVFLLDDVAALNMNAKFGVVGVQAAYAKFYEDSKNVNDDANLYILGANVKPNDTTTAGLDIFWLEDQALDTYAGEGTVGVTQGTLTRTAKGTDTAVKLGLATVSLYADAGVGPATVGGFVAVQSGKATDDVAGTPDVKLSGIAGSIAAKMKMEKAAFGARVLYYSADDKDDEKVKSFQGGLGIVEYMNEGLNIFLADALKTNGANDRRALIDAAYEGYGLLGLVVNGKVDLDPMYVKGALGYFQALEDTLTDEDGNKDKVEGKDLGLEVALDVGVKVDVATVSLRGSYAMLGSFYDAPAGGTDPDDLYMTALMLNIPY